MLAIVLSAAHLMSEGTPNVSIWTQGVHTTGVDDMRYVSQITDPRSVHMDTFGVHMATLGVTIWTHTPCLH